MIEVLKNLTGDNIISICSLIVTILVVFITAYLNTKNSKVETVSEMFKKRGIEIQEQLLEFWSWPLISNFEKSTKAYIKKNKIKETNEIINLIFKDCIMYSSKKTIKAIGTYQQYVYKVDDLEKKSKQTIYETMRSIILPLRVTVRMKCDFTGEKIRVMDLLRIKINDLNINKIVVSYYILIIYYIKELFVLI